MIWFGWILWQINHCRLFNAKSSLYIYQIYMIWFGWVFLVNQLLYVISCQILFIHIIIIIIYCCLQKCPKLSLTICLYHWSLLTGFPGFILCQYWAVDKFLLVILHLCVHVKGSIGECHLWVCPCTSSSIPHFVHWIWMVFEIGGRYPYSCCFVGCCFQDLSNIACSILMQLPSSFFSLNLVSVHVVHPYSSMDTIAAWKKLHFILLDKSG